MRPAELIAKRGSSAASRHDVFVYSRGKLGFVANTGEPINRSFLHTDTSGLCNSYVLDGPVQVEFWNNRN